MTKEPVNKELAAWLRHAAEHGIWHVRGIEWTLCLAAQRLESSPAMIDRITERAPPIPEEIAELRTRALEWAGNVKAEYSDEGEAFIIDLAAALQRQAQEIEKQKNLVGAANLNIKGFRKLWEKRIRTAEAERDRLLAMKAELVEALENVRKIISEAAATGFNFKDSDWAERLYASQHMTRVAVTKAKAEAPETEEKA